MAVKSDSFRNENVGRHANDFTIDVRETMSSFNSELSAPPDERRLRTGRSAGLNVFASDSITRPCARYKLILL